MSAYVEAGYGPCIVFLAPLGGSHEMFTSQLEAFSSDHRSIAVTLRGNPGAQSLSGVSVSEVIATQAEDVMQLLRSLGVPRAHLVGVGLGGAVAQHIALHHEGMLRSLVLADTWASLRPRNLADRLLAATQRSTAAAYLLPKPLLRGTILNTYLRWPAAGKVVADELMRCDRKELSLQQRAWTAIDNQVALAGVNVATLCLAGESSLHLMTLGRRMSRMIPDARFVGIPHCMDPSNLCQPEAFNTELRRFIDNLPTGW